MVLIPIIGIALLDIVEMISSGKDNAATSVWVYIIGFLAAYISGFLACKWMIALVQKSKLYYFSIYCFVIGTIAIAYSYFYL